MAEKSLSSLMEEHRISERSARLYLDTRQFYDGLRLKVVESLREEGVYVNPDVPEISNLCSSVRDYVHLAFDSWAIGRAEQLHQENKGLWIPRINRIRPVYDLLPGQEEPDTNIWDFDFPRFLQSFYHLSESESEEQSFKLSLVCILYGTHPYFEGRQRSLTFNDCQKDDKIIVRQTNFCELADGEYDCRGDLIVSLTEGRCLADWLEGIHSQIPDELPKFDLRSVTTEERDLLYNSYEVYTLAKEQGTLNEPRVERAIAVAFVKSSDYSCEEALEELHRQEEAAMQRKKQLLEVNAPKSVMDSVEVSIERILYGIRAVKKHKEWI